MNTILHASKIYFTDGTFQPGIVVLAEDGTITYAGSAASATNPQGNHLDFGDHSTVPGFIDRVIREEDRMGSLTGGKLACLAILDAQLEVAAIFVKGKKVYERGL